MLVEIEITAKSQAENIDGLIEKYLNAIASETLQIKVGICVHNMEYCKVSICPLYSIKLAIL